MRRLVSLVLLAVVVALGVPASAATYETARVVPSEVIIKKLFAPPPRGYGDVPPADLSVMPTDVDPTKPMIALTFDDGPGKGTERILDTLESCNARATFFMVGNLVGRKAASASRMVSLGCEVGNHTYEHKMLRNLSYWEIYDQIDLANQAIEAATGVRPSVMRPTGGEYNDDVQQAARGLGVAMINWSVDTRDWKDRDAQIIYQRVMEDVSDGAIVICHDIYESTADAMEYVIPELIAQGYQLVTVSELLSYRAGGMMPGEVYKKR
jgi:peptidoglycan/xylan/chitin deacetylase (PgdA/CDA1 family)